MKKNLGLIILIALMCGIAAFLAYVVVSKQNVSKTEFNLSKGEVIEFKEYDIKATVLNVASTLCDKKDTCISPGEVEVSVKVEYNDNVSYYTLKTVNNPEERIKKSNYYINLKYEDKKLSLNVREK